MKTKRFFSAIVAFLAFAFTALAQNMTQKQANENLTGTWRADGKTLVISASGNTHSANIFGQDFDNWSIYTNTFNFESGSLQATNSSPFRNITIKYRFLTANSCEFFIDGNWVKASKSGGSQRPATNTVSRPETNNNKVQLPANNNKVQQPATGTIQRQDNNNGNIRQPETSNNNVRQPETNNNNVRRPINESKIQRPAKGTMQRQDNNVNLRRPAGNNIIRRPVNKNNGTDNRNESATSTDNSTRTTDTPEPPMVIN